MSLHLKALTIADDAEVLCPEQTYRVAGGGGKFHVPSTFVKDLKDKIFIFHFNTLLALGMKRLLLHYLGWPGCFSQR